MFGDRLSVFELVCWVEYEEFQNERRKKVEAKGNKK